MKTAIYCAVSTSTIHKPCMAFKVIKKEKQMKEVDVTIESYSLCDKCNEKIKTGSYDAFECEFYKKD